MCSDIEVDLFELNPDYFLVILIYNGLQYQFRYLYHYFAAVVFI